jgi:hypothetical protein
MYNEIRIEEYRYLREEHQKNRSYIFERPLLIISIVALVTQYLIQYRDLYNLQGQDVLASLTRLVMFPILIVILYFNLSFISERVNSDARLVSYLQLFHEDNLSLHWIGWETSLRHYREWRNLNLKNIEKRLDSRIEKKSVFHIGWFYPKIYYFHIFFAIIVSCIWCFVAYQVNMIIFIAITIISFILLCFFVPLHNFKFENQLEKERAIWNLVYEECWKKE